jgi:uncharacterized protein YejL (UPF0352 family)
LLYIIVIYIIAVFSGFSRLLETGLSLLVLGKIITNIANLEIKEDGVSSDFLYSSVTQGEKSLVQNYM